MFPERLSGVSLGQVPPNALEEGNTVSLVAGRDNSVNRGLTNTGRQHFKRLANINHKRVWEHRNVNPVACIVEYL